MIARKVAARLKPNSLTKFKNLMEGEILPWLRRQEGFVDVITLAAPDGREVATISFWDHPGNAQAYHSSGYPEALQILGELLDGAPYVKTFEVVSSTCKVLVQNENGDGRINFLQRLARRLSMYGLHQQPLASPFRR